MKKNYPVKKANCYELSPLIGNLCSINEINETVVHSGFNKFTEPVHPTSVLSFFNRPDSFKVITDKIYTRETLCRFNMPLYKFSEISHYWFLIRMFDISNKAALNGSLRKYKCAIFHHLFTN